MDISQNEAISPPQPRMDIMGPSKVVLEQQKVMAVENQSATSESVGLIPKQSSFRRNVFFMVVAVLLLGFGAYAIVKYNNSIKIIDRKYGFKFNNLKGWTKIPPREGAYLSLATIEENKFVISYADIRVTPNPIPDKYIDIVMNKDYMDEFSQTCQNVAREENLTFVEVQKAYISNSNSYKCIYEGLGENSNGNTLVIESYAITKPKNNLVITTSYQKNLPAEKLMVENLMMGFHVLK